MLQPASPLRLAYAASEPRPRIAAPSHRGQRRIVPAHPALVPTPAAPRRLAGPVPAPLVHIAGVFGASVVLPVLLFTALYPSNWRPALLAVFGAVVVALAALRSQGESLVPARPVTADERESRQRRTLTAGVTHELRTPLTILKGRLHAIEDGVIRPDGEETTRLLRQVDHVLRIVEDFDLLSQAEIGAPSLHRQRTELGGTVAAVVADLRPLFARHDLTIVETYQPNAVLHADPARLVQIATNLITNAAKHSPAGGRILIDVERCGAHIRLSVRDEGPGFAPADRERMFAPFWRSKASVARPGCYGTGMGLALTAGLVQAHGGRIVAENRAERSGACFRVLFPAA